MSGLRKKASFIHPWGLARDDMDIPYTQRLRLYEQWVLSYLMTKGFKDNHFPYMQISMSGTNCIPLHHWYRAQCCACLPVNALKANLAGHAVFNPSIYHSGSKPELVDRLRRILERRQADRVVKKIVWGYESSTEESNEGSEEAWTELDASK